MRYIYVYIFMYIYTYSIYVSTTYLMSGGRENLIRRKQLTGSKLEGTSAKATDECARLRYARYSPDRSDCVAYFTAA